MVVCSEALKRNKEAERRLRKREEECIVTFLTIAPAR